MIAIVTPAPGLLIFGVSIAFRLHCSDEFIEYEFTILSLSGSNSLSAWFASAGSWIRNIKTKGTERTLKINFLIIKFYNFIRNLAK